MDFKQFYENFYFDVDNEITLTYRAKQGDTGSRGLYVTLKNNGLIIPVTSETMVFYASKPDGKRVLIDAVKDMDKFRVDFTNQTFTAAGNVECELLLRGSNGEAISSKTFKIKVDYSLRENSVVSTDERGVVDKAFQLAIDIVPRLEALDVPLMESLQSISIIEQATPPNNSKFWLDTSVL